jgi:hypothetical protein
MGFAMTIENEQLLMFLPISPCFQILFRPRVSHLDDIANQLTYASATGRTLIGLDAEWV